MRIVLDSNVLVSSLGRKSHLRPIWDAFTKGSYQLIVSEDILKEYEEICCSWSSGTRHGDFYRIT